MEHTLQYIAKTLMQYDNTDSDIGLFYGNMGIAIFLFHYARFTGDQTYREKAVMMTNNCIREAIRQHSRYDYANGLAGVGTGVEYLIQNDFVKADANRVLKKFDKIVFRYTVYGKRNDAGLFTGYSGLGRYLLFRVAGQCNNDEHIGTLDNKMLLINITDIVERKYPSLNNQEIEDVLGFLYAMDQANIYPAKIKRLIQQFTSGSASSNQEAKETVQKQKKTETLYCGKYNQLLSEIRENTPLRMAFGLCEGLAGIGLYILNKSNKQHKSWMQLL